MILRHARQPGEAATADDTFEAVDEHSGKTFGSCSILTRENTWLFPNRPYRVYIDIQGDPVPDALLGAAVARAKNVARASGKRARVFASVDPQDTARMSVLSALGLKDNDGIIVLEKKLDDSVLDPEYHFPSVCTLVRDELKNEVEQRFFLERYNQVMGASMSRDDLFRIISAEGFHRTVVFSNQGLAGEIAWYIDDYGIAQLAWLYIPAQWRRMRIGSSLIESTLNYIYKTQKISYVQCTIQAKMPCVLRLMEGYGFTQKELLQRYPGTDIDPMDDAKIETEKRKELYNEELREVDQTE